MLALKGGRLVTEQVIESHRGVVNGSHVQVAPDLFLGGITSEEVDATLIGYNHSCSPNAYIDGQIALRALQTIAEGEEITVDYATTFSSDTQEFICRCGSDHCRHTIKPSVDSSSSELQASFKGRFVDFLAHPEAYEDVALQPIDPDCPTTSYLTTKIHRVEAKIHGLGLATLEPIGRGELLAVRGGTLVTKDLVLAHQDQLKGSEVQVTDEVFLAGFSEQERLATLMGFNHSCEPNSFLRGQIGIFALDDIPAGEELTADYATLYINPSQRFACNCGSASCRHFIDSTVDWENPALQQKYRGHFADFVQRKIDQE